MIMPTEHVEVVLVHGAWADGSSWNAVTRELQSRGLHVVAAPIPMTSLPDDVRALERALERAKGPVVLGAHACAGAVTSAVKNEHVRALVFINSLTPDLGESVADIFYREQPHPKAPQLAPGTDGVIWMPEESFQSAFAHYATPEQAALLAATQRPIAVSCIQKKVPQPSWKTTPSWYLIAEEDRMIHPKTQRFLAERMGARVRSAKVDHAPLVTDPRSVVDTLMEAIEEVRKSVK